jgi:hypothetical protein
MLLAAILAGMIAARLAQSWSRGDGAALQSGANA